MPELPEVETVVRDLRPLLVGVRIESVVVGRAKLRRQWKAAWSKAVTSREITGISRRGKWIIVALDSPLRLLVHLGMTGQFTVNPATDERQNHTHILFTLSSEQELRFRDVRRFGSVEVFPDDASLTAFLNERLGPEPWELEPVAFRQTVQKSNRPLKAILLDQLVVAGVGNIYADEALHRAKLHPEHRGIAATDAEVERLRLAIAAVISHAIECRGSTIRDYIGGSGLRGGFQDEFRVYGRTGQPCETCRTPIAMLRVAGRSSHFCPRCQPEPK